ncbi:hypothetical protein B0H14DRAFT_3473582 [Mycena olivaceomarginata]|nr:hypothetical protein B0H14DRAFT_3473582 [Mycena olivaceomarginata]
MVLATLFTIAPWHRIHTVVICVAECDLDYTEFVQLDSILSALPVNPPPTVEIEYVLALRTSSFRV